MSTLSKPQIEPQQQVPPNEQEEFVCNLIILNC